MNKKINKKMKKNFPKAKKYFSLIIVVVFLIISLVFYIEQFNTGKYIRENFGEAVYNIFKDNNFLEKTKIKESNNGKILWYIDEDSGELEIAKEDNEYMIYILSNVQEEKIQLYPFLEIEKQNIEKLYKVLRVVDGDTVKIEYNGKQESVRLIGIDTPESVHRDKSKNTEEGEVASDYTKDRLEGKEVKLEFDVAPRDRYNRLLAYVYIDGEMFNKELLEKGYARIATFPPNVKYVEEFTEIQKSAINGKKGFWKNKIWDEEK